MKCKYIFHNLVTHLYQECRKNSGADWKFSETAVIRQKTKQTTTLI